MALDRPFRDREHAGRELARYLVHYRDRSPLILGLPNGGVPVAYEVARALGAPLDVWVAKKLAIPARPEFAIGAVAEGGELYLDGQVMHDVGMSESETEAMIRQKTAEVAERCRRFRGRLPPPGVKGKTVIVVDDGMATGATMRAALRAVRRRQPQWLVLAVPVAARAAVESLRNEVDEVLCLSSQVQLYAVGVWYDDFRPVADDEVKALLDRAREEIRPEDASAATRAVPIDVGDAILPGDLIHSKGAKGIVLFGHGSGSRSPQNRFVAEVFAGAGLATLLFDFLTEEEQAVDANAFDVDLLARRLVGATDWTRRQPETRRLPIGYFAANAGAAAELMAAGERPDEVQAIVSRSGRLDLVRRVLPRVRAATLLLVGSDDPEALRLNRSALEHLGGASRLCVVPDANHLFDEPVALEQVADMAASWMSRHLGGLEAETGGSSR